MANLKKVLNPSAPEFTPSNNLTPDLSIFLNPPPPAARAAYCLPPQTVVYYQHHHHHHFSKQLIAYNPPHHHKSDEGLGLISSPTSPLSPSFIQSPTTPLPPPPPLPHQHNFHNIKKPTRKHIKPSARVTPNLKLNVKWVKKQQMSPMPETTLTLTPVHDDDDDEAVPIGSYPFGDCTSLMIRNIPVRLSRSELMEMLDAHCRSQNENLPPSQPASQFDFLYLPIDFKRKGNLGYAFVNFTSWEGASRLYNSWKGTNWRMCSFNTAKICQIHPAKFQGKKLKKHFEQSVFQCESKEYLPIELAPPRDGSNADLTCISTIGSWVCHPALPNLLH